MIDRMVELYTRLSLAARKDDGATAVEYGLLVALIAAVIVATVAFLGTDVLGGFRTVETAIDGVPNG